MSKFLAIKAPWHSPQPGALAARSKPRYLVATYADGRGGRVVYAEGNKVVLVCHFREKVFTFLF